MEFNPLAFLGNLFHKIFSGLQQAWEKMSPFVKSFVTTLFQDALGVAMETIFPIVRDALIEVQNDPSVITDEDRRGEAFRRITARIDEAEIRDHLLALGVRSVTALINRAIEEVLEYLHVRGLMPPNAGAAEQ